MKMVDSSDNAGFALLEVVLIIVVLFVIGGTAAAYYSRNHLAKPATENTLSPAPSTAVSAPVSKIIVMYGDAADEQRARQLIAANGGTILRQYDVLFGFEVTVPGGSEDRFVSELKTHPEIISASRNQVNTVN